MQTQTGVYAPIEFSVHNPGNLIRVENRGKTVVIRAAWNNFSERRKAFLIRELAAEGYISDRFERFTEQERMPGLTWVIDRSLCLIGPEATGRTRRFMHRLIASLCLLWVVEVTLAYLRG